MVPKLYATWEFDDFARFSEYCHRTFRDGAGVPRQVLMNLVIHWKELALAGSGPYPLSTSEQ